MMPPHRPESEPSTHDYPPGPRFPALPGLDAETLGRSPTTQPNQDVLQTFPTVLGEYDLLHVAGEGGMGVVLQARHRPSGKVVALKVLKPAVSLAPELVLRFRREIRIADLLRHPNIATVHEVGEHEGRLFYTMPFAPTNLARQRRRFADPKTAARLLVTVARAVHHAHAHGVIHRDLKPGNILLTADDEPLITDFGLARWVDASQQLTQFGDLMGTPAYMAPEQAAGPSDLLGPSADVWALGVILYELLTGQRPFEGEASAVLHQIHTADPPPQRQYRADLDPALEAVVLKCLRKKPSERYATAAALADDLQRWLDGRPVQAQALPASLPSGPSAQSARSPRIAAATLLVAMAGLLAFGLGAVPRSDVMPPRVVEDGIDWATLVPSPAKEKWVEQRLAAGQSVEMVVPSVYGFRWYHRPFGNSLIRPDPADRGVKFAHPETNVVELVSKPPSAGYQLEARLIHHDRSAPVGAVVGVYFGYAQSAGAKSISSFLRWTFNDLDDAEVERKKALEKAKIDLPPGRMTQGGNVVRLQAVVFDTAKRSDVNLAELRQRDWKDTFSPACRNGPGVPPPRRLAVAVRPDGVTAFFEGNAVGHVSSATIDEKFREVWKSARLPEGQEPTFDPAGRLGVWVQSSTAVIQSFRVIPRSQE